MIAWLVDAAAIISQKALLKCSYAPYARIMKKICWEESFHILHGRDVILAMVTGTPEQFELVQEALNRWWGPLMQFHGNPIPAEEDPMVHLADQDAGERGGAPAVPRGLRAADPASSASRSPTRSCASDDDGVWEYTEPDWDELQRVVTGPRAGDGRSGSRSAALSRAERMGAGRSVLRGGGVIWEVFRQERKGQPFEHAGSVVAPDAEFAEAWAREQYGRRGESVALWLVPRDAIHEIEDWADEFDLKYRRVDGYSIKARLKEARERAGTTAARAR